MPPEGAPSFQPAIRYLQDCHTRGLFPGASAAVLVRGELRLKICIGGLTPDSASPRITSKTVFDLASLTKPVATALAALLLIHDGRLQLGDPVSRYLPELIRTPYETATVVRLLTHTSGLPAWKPVYATARSREEVPAAIAAFPPVYSQGTRVEYSCLGFILLAELIRRITGETLDDITRRRIFQPLGMSSTGFNPPMETHSQIAPTEFGNAFERALAGDEGAGFDAWRERRLQGEVHDGNAFFMAGEGGNAGLFSSTHDLLIFARWMLDSIRTGSGDLLPACNLRQATENQTAGLNSHRGLGWQLAGTATSPGTRISNSAYGHTGFTGTSIWIDPVRDAAVILLTNRAFFGGNGAEFAATRGPFHDLVIAGIDGSQDSCIPGE